MSREIDKKSPDQCIDEIESDKVIFNKDGRAYLFNICRIDTDTKNYLEIKKQEPDCYPFTGSSSCNFKCELYHH